MKVFLIKERLWYAASTAEEAVRTAAKQLGLPESTICGHGPPREISGPELEVPVVPGDTDGRMGTVASHLPSVTQPCLLFSPFPPSAPKRLPATIPESALA